MAQWLLFSSSIYIQKTSCCMPITNFSESSSYVSSYNSNNHQPLPYFWPLTKPSRPLHNWLCRMYDSPHILWGGGLISNLALSKYRNPLYNKVGASSSCLHNHDTSFRWKTSILRLKNVINNLRYYNSFYKKNCCFFFWFFMRSLILT